jgi:uncharacterized protein (DUF302 family)
MTPASAPYRVVQTRKSFAEAVVAVRRAVEQAKWGILGAYDLSEIMTAKGFPQTEQFKSLDICAPAHAASMVKANQLTALCMPCSVLVFTEGGATKLAAMQPGAVMPQLFPEAAATLGSLPQEVDRELAAILETAAN